MAKRQKPQIYVGDIGNVPEKYIDKVAADNLKNDVDTMGERILNDLSPTEQLQTALALGGNATDLLGVDKCYEHFEYKELGGRHVSGLNYATDVVYCKNCFTYYYKKAK